MSIDELFNLFLDRHNKLAPEVAQLTIPQALMALRGGKKRNLVSVPIGQYGAWRREKGFS